MKKPYSTIQPRQSEPATDRRSHQYHSVAIRYYENDACPVVKKFEVKLHLSDKAPLFLETKRFLSSEAPLLPLDGCTLRNCQCRYVHYEDRRERDRRNLYSHTMASAPAFAGQERRSRTDRRQF